MFPPWIRWFSLPCEWRRPAVSSSPGAPRRPSAAGARSAPLAFALLVTLLGGPPAASADNLALLSGTLRTYQRAGCEGEQVILRCPPGTSISVQVAQYGRPPPTSSVHRSIVSSSTLYKPPPLCNGGGSGSSPSHGLNTTCHWPSALQYSLLQTVVEACQKKRQCKFQVTAKALGGGAAAVEDICPGSSKFVEVAYKCRPFEFRSKVACEDEAAELRCGSHARIAVYSASFGRTEYESIQCPQPQGVPEETCLVSYATETAMQMCHGKRKCILNANAATFGNPCKQESRMYLKIVYTCVPRKVLKERYEEKTEDGDWGHGDEDDDDEEEEEDPSRANEEYDSYGGTDDEDLFRESSPFSPPPLRPDDEDSEFGGGPGKAQPSLVGKSPPGGPTPRPHSKGGSLPTASAGNREKLYLYVCVSVGGGLVVLLSAVAGRLYLSRRRENRRMRRRGVGGRGGQGHSSSSGGGSGGDEGNSGADSNGGGRGGVTLPNGFLAAEDVDMMSEIDADIDLMVASTSPRPPPPQPVQIMSSAGGEVLGVGGGMPVGGGGGGGGCPSQPPGGGGRTPVPPPFVPPGPHAPPVGQVVRYGHPRAGGSVLGVRRQDSDTNPRSLSRSGNNQYYYA